MDDKFIWVRAFGEREREKRKEVDSFSKMFVT